MRALETTVALSLAALTLSLSLTATPAAAKPMMPHGGHGRHGGFFGPALAFGLIGAIVATGVAAESCTEYRPMYDQFGNYIGRRAINVCE